jgi:phosphatidylglycerophosphatase C
LVTVAEVAAFDVDGTLTRSDTVVPYLATVVGWPRVLVALSWAIVRGAGRRDAVKARLVRATLTGVGGERLRVAGEAMAERMLGARANPAVLGRLRWHLDAGHTVVFVSASLRPYLEPLARTLGVHHVLCTEIHVDADGRCTGRLDGPNCRGREKLRRLQDWLAPGDRLVAAYGDAASDEPLLAAAEEGWWVRRGRLERAVA